MPVMVALEKLKQEDPKFENSSGYRARSKISLAYTARSHLRKLGKETRIFIL